MKVGVIGVGSMGRNHVRVLDELGVLVSVCDPDPAVLERYSSMARYNDHIEMLALEGLDAISVAVPTSLHYEIGMAVIERGVSVLIEKPIAAIEADAKTLIEAAKKNDVFLATGLIERFNPAIVALKERWHQLGDVSQIIIRRMGPFPERIRDTGVILDLAVHDFDLVWFLGGSEMKRMYGLSSQSVHKEKEDAVVCIGETESGILTTILENWTTPTKVRDMTVHGSHGMFHVDLLMQDLTFYENNYAPAEWRELGVFRGVSEGDRIQYRIERREPLKQELVAFLRCVEDRDAEGSVSGEEGLRALRLAKKLQSECRWNDRVKETV